MTYARLKKLTSALLTGDNRIPKDAEEVQELVRYGLYKVAEKAEALKLLTANSDEEILRMGPGSVYVRMPEIPDTDTDELDIDEDLMFALATYVASFISRDRKSEFERRADKLIILYNIKVNAFIEQKEKEALIFKSEG